MKPGDLVRVQPIASEKSFWLGNQWHAWQLDEAGRYVSKSAIWFPKDEILVFCGLSHVYEGLTVLLHPTFGRLGMHLNEVMELSVVEVSV